MFFLERIFILACTSLLFTPPTAAMFPKGRSSALVYGLNYKARALDSQQQTRKNCFLIGTLTLSEQNQIHHVEVNEELTDVKRVAIYDHPHEIWSIHCSPHASEMFFTVYNTVPTFKVSLWRAGGGNNKLTELGQLGDHEGHIRKVVWDPAEEKRVTTIDDRHIRQWDASTLQSTVVFDGHDLDKFSSGCAIPYKGNQFVVASNETLRVFDLSSKKEVITIPNAHEIGIRDVDVNPNNPYYFVTGGDDSRVCFWDSRNVKTPVSTFIKHHHWVTRVKYNSYKDALVLSAGSCGTVNLWNMNSIAFQNPSQDADLRPPVADHHVRTFTDHEDAITSLAWSCANANSWLFATLSYDGRVIINRVPDSEVKSLMD